MENAHLRVYRYTTSSDTPIFYMDYIDKSHYVIVCPTHIHTKSIPQGIPVSTNSMFHGAHELMLNPTQPDSYPMGISMEIPMNLGISHGNFPWISHAYLQLVDPLFLWNATANSWGLHHVASGVCLCTAMGWRKLPPCRRGSKISKGGNGKELSV
jgi:hypothetical protein